MITDFSDEADKLLVQLALKCAQQNQRVVWSDVARKMQRRLRVSKSPKELETRLRTLKRAHANDLSRVVIQATRSRSHSTCNAKTRQPRHHVLDFQATRAGALHENAGELVPQALSEVMNIIGPVALPNAALVSKFATNYLNWVASSFSDTQTCNHCSRKCCYYTEMQKRLGCRSAQDIALHAGTLSAQHGSYIKLLVAK
ncbi:hypothetical protein PC118_g15907 [Phytophthora cactorum]|uniref:Uncharacterized protein n=1 Tax=Phytophthora cactorum TaxID=29920 RepID=A0A8T1FP94_9STRA|nr:hypothetical protein PC112_g16239 [Phytophthora cactorum]KAG2811421.1 hypothetical protein PC111_g15243 [Phytophthora cactorum]KAG2863332.1 hypothetical protein PC113_g5562 [Phytophthora cactorum]KAG2972052.1 hypothetical protein PC118_g15907 [Phytophthora cactorum]KAG3143741.1 hypothetical protein C6341_g18971 [Phytophthora cactorum]